MKKIFLLYIGLLAGDATIAQNVGIGTSTPSAKLHVNGTFKVVDGTQGAGKISPAMPQAWPVGNRLRHLPQFIIQL